MHKSNSQSFDIASFITEQPAGSKFTTRAIHQKMNGRHSLGAIAGTVHRLCYLVEPPVLEPDHIGPRGATVYRLLRNDLSQVRFHSAPAHFERGGSSDSRAPTRDEHKTQLCLQVFREMALIELLEEDELWDELARREEAEKDNDEESD